MSDARLNDANARPAMGSTCHKLMNAVKHSGCWGVPARRLAVALSAKTRADYHAVGFPLQSLTRNARLVVTMVLLTLSPALIAGSHFDTLRTAFSTCHTKADFDSSLHRSFSEFRIEHSGETFSRELDFSYRQSVYYLMVFYNTNSVEEYRVYLMLDSTSTIVFGTLQLLDPANDDRVYKSNQFRLDEKWLAQYTRRHRALYDLKLEQSEVLKQLTQLIVYGFDCGFGGGYDPPTAKKMEGYVEHADLKSLGAWLRQASPELQAYGATGLLQLQRKGSTIPPDDLAIIDHLKRKNTEIYSCSGCIFGMTTPLSLLLTQRLDREP